MNTIAKPHVKRLIWCITLLTLWNSFDIEPSEFSFYPSCFQCACSRNFVTGELENEYYDLVKYWKINEVHNIIVEVY